jgi:hypothetical protein
VLEGPPPPLPQTGGEAADEDREYHARIGATGIASSTVRPADAEMTYDDDMSTAFALDADADMDMDLEEDELDRDATGVDEADDIEDGDGDGDDLTCLEDDIDPDQVDTLDDEDKTDAADKTDIADDFDDGDVDGAGTLVDTADPREDAADVDVDDVGLTGGAGPDTGDAGGDPGSGYVDYSMPKREGKMPAAEAQLRLVSKCRAMLGMRKKPKKVRVALESVLDFEDGMYLPDDRD